MAGSKGREALQSLWLRRTAPPVGSHVYSSLLWNALFALFGRSKRCGLLFAKLNTNATRFGVYIKDYLLHCIYNKIWVQWAGSKVLAHLNKNTEYRFSRRNTL